MGLVGSTIIDKSLGEQADYIKQIKAKILSIFQQIVRQGVKEGLFQTDYTDETAEILFFVSLYLNRELRNIRDPIERRKKIDAVRIMMERTLGTHEGLFRSSH